MKRSDLKKCAFQLIFSVRAFDLKVRNQYGNGNGMNFDELTG